MRTTRSMLPALMLPPKREYPPRAMPLSRAARPLMRTLLPSTIVRRREPQIVERRSDQGESAIGSCPALASDSGGQHMSSSKGGGKKRKKKGTMAGVEP